MINTKDLETVIALSLATGYVEDERPVSLIIVSQRPESGKSAILGKFSNIPGVAVLSNATAAAIWRDYGDRIGKGEIKHFFIPEFLAPISRGTSTTSSFMSTLQMMVEEGLVSYHSGFLKGPMTFNVPRVVGVIACMPKTAYERSRLGWQVSGFLSRFMVVSYSYDQETVDAIIEHILDAGYLKESNVTLQFPQESVAVEVLRPVANKCRDLSLAITEESRNHARLYGFREIKNILRMVKANVILDNALKGGKRTTASIADYEAVEALSYLFNEQFNEVKQ